MSALDGASCGEQEAFEVSGEVELFPQEGGWYYVAIPRWISDELQHLVEGGLVPVRATVGTTTWDTSLLPMGDGSQFVALKASVRKAAGIDVGEPVVVTFTPRRR